MSWFKCKHEPDDRLSGEPKVIRGHKYIYTLVFVYREIVTQHVCKKCDVVYVTRHDVDEKSARIGRTDKETAEKKPHKK